METRRSPRNDILPIKKEPRSPFPAPPRQSIRVVYSPARHRGICRSGNSARLCTRDLHHPGIIGPGRSGLRSCEITSITNQTINKEFKMAIEIQTQDLADRIENAAVHLLQGHAASPMLVALVVQGVYLAAGRYFSTHCLSLGHRVTIESRVRERITENHQTGENLPMK